ncbi:MAG TPA: AIR synthase-related protein, partial [Bacteroidales bacterium]|nr:AIR synthase-related protein [Bacteroidales bacterium]
KEVLDNHRREIHGMIHCSGGAQTKVMNFVSNKHIVKDNMFNTPPLFKLIQQESGTSWQEMYQVFNMGHRFEIYTDEDTAEEITKIADSFNIESRIIGRVEASERKRLSITTAQGNYDY